MLRQLAALALLLGLSSCGEGRLHITLERPSTQQLDPMQDPRLAKFSLRVVEAGEATDQDAFWTSESELVVGQVRTGASFDLRLAGKAATDDVLGLGQVFDVPPIEGESDVEVKFRKPIGFIAGGPSLEVLNTAGEADSVELPPVALAAAQGVAATPSGVWLLALDGSSLVPVRTIDHTVQTAASLSAEGRCIGVSPDGRTAVVCHDDGVSVVPLDLIGSGGVQGVPVSLSAPGRPSQVAFASRRVAWVLIDGVKQANCAGATPSTLVQLDVVSRQEVAPAITLDQPAGDVAVDPDGAVLLSLPCGGHLGSLQGGAAVVGPETPGAQDIVLTDRGIVALGAAEDPTRVVAWTFDRAQGGLDATPQVREFGLPPLIVQFTSTGSSAGSFAWISEPQGLHVGDVAVSPDGRRATALFSAHYSSSIAFGDCQFAAEVDADGYLLLDLASGTILLERYTQMNFTNCVANCLKYMDTPTGCADQIRDLLKQVSLLLEPPFVPTSTTLLFGGN